MAHGEALFVFDALRSPGEFHLGFSPEFPIDFSSLRQKANNEFPDDSEPSPDPDDVIESNLLQQRAPDCVGSLELRAELLRISAFLHKLAPDRVVVHNDQVSVRIQKRLDEGSETKAFVCLDVEHVVDQWAQFKAWFPNVSPSVQAGRANKLMLGALVDVLNINVQFESMSDIVQLTECVRDIAAVESFSPASVCRADLSSVACVDVSVMRTRSRVRAALNAGVQTMCVGSLGGIQTIAAVAGKRSIANPPLSLILSVSSAAADLSVPLSCGASINPFDLLSFAPSDIFGAADCASKFGMTVSGVRADVATLLSGYVEDAIACLMKSVIVLKKKKPNSVVFILENLCDLIAENGCSTPADERDKLIAKINDSISSIENRLDVELIVSADASTFLLSSSATLFARIIGARPSIGDDGECVGRQFYIDDGIYGSLCQRNVSSTGSGYSAFTVGCASSSPFIVKSSRGDIARICDLPSVVWGQTCDSIDKVMSAETAAFPADFGLGDWLAFPGVSMTGNSTNTGFNGYDAPQTRFMVHTGFE